MNWLAVEDTIRRALNEDLGHGDITTELLPETGRHAAAVFLAKQDGVLCGAQVAVRCFTMLDLECRAEFGKLEGSEISAGELIGRVEGAARSILSAERVALNFLQHMSGIATLARRLALRAAPHGIRVVETRKTTPGLRTLEKYAVRVGGGKSHRKDLSEAVLIKENHIRMAGGVSAALAGAQAAKGRAAWIEIEVTNLEELREALPHNPHVILLDNMGPSLTREAVEEVGRHGGPHPIRTEASGGITLDNVRAFAEAGVNWISVGALTHSAPAVDLSFEIEPV
jgi:nicotinate-nucleotide pyrophosphorylase (carboxylating)